MRKIFTLAMLFMAFALTGCFGDSDEGNLGLLKGDTIKIGVDDKYAPLGFRDENEELIGFDVDLAKEAARRMNVKVEFVPITWDNKETEITSGNVDLIWNGLDVTDERKEYMIFSKPYMDNRQVLMVKRGNKQDIQSEYDLKGKVVGTQSGSSSNDYINEREDLKDSFKTFKTYANFQEAFEELDSDSVDVLIVDELAARYEVILHPRKFEVIEATIGNTTEIAVGFRKDNVELRDKIQSVFDDMIKDGTAKKISEHWFQADLIKAKR